MNAVKVDSLTTAMGQAVAHQLGQWVVLLQLRSPTDAVRDREAARRVLSASKLGRKPAMRKRSSAQPVLEKLRRARKVAGLTQKQVAGRFGKPQSYISKVERGERRLDPVELAELAALYEREVAWFLNVEGVGPKEG